jgi:biotin carboxyl carrier protein
MAPVKLHARVGDRTRDVTVSPAEGSLRVIVDGVERRVDARKIGADSYSLLIDGRSYEVSVEPRGSAYLVRADASERLVELSDPGRRTQETPRSTGTGPQIVTSVMPGKVARVLVSVGDTVEAGSGLVVIEAMKMENEITSPRAGRVTAVEVEQGRTVESGAPLVIIEG